MNKAEEILDKHLKLRSWNNTVAKNGNLYNTLLDAINEAINYTPSCKGDINLLPDFLYEDHGIIKVGVHGDSAVTDEWNDYLKKLGNYS